MPQLRQNLITGEWVVIAPERAKRPNEFITADTVRHQSRQECIFCQGTQAWKTRLKSFDTKTTYLVPNKFPAFVSDLSTVSPRSYRLEGGFYSARASVGGHDVVVVLDHEQNLPTFTQEIWVDLLTTFQKRYQAFEKQGNVEYTMPIYNQGPEAGMSIEHPHAQIFASNILPNRVALELEQTNDYFQANGACAFDDLIAHELHEKVRLVVENERFLAFSFYAARFPFETWIVPREHKSRFETESQESLADLAGLMQDLLSRFDRGLNDPPLNIFFHSLPHSVERSDSYHWHIEIAPRLSTYGGFELGSGVVIDIISPEEAAKFLRAQRVEKKAGGDGTSLG